MKPLSILHVGKFYPPHPGGMETHVYDLAVRQARIAKVSVVVANSVMRNDITDNEGVHIVRVARFTTIASMPVCPGLAAAIHSCPAELVHIHMPNPGAALAFLISGHTGKLIVEHHADTLGRRILRRFSDPFVKRLMQRASRIIVTSTRYLNSSPELMPYRDKCRIVPAGIDIQNACGVSQLASQRVRQQFGERLILAVGRLVPYKGFDVLIRAMKHVDARLVLIGTGPQHDALKRLASVECVEGRVDMLGRVDELGPYFAAASIFVFPSLTRAEAFGLVQLEAMAAGLPVINTDIDSAVPEVCIHGKTGITVPPGDPIALSEAIQTLLDRQDLRVQLGNAARERVSNEYTSDLMAERTLSVYSEALGIDRSDISFSAITP